MKILFTGFEPFGGDLINSAYESVKAMPDYIENAEILKAELPTVFNKSIEVLVNTIKDLQPDIVVCVGQAGGYSKIAVERVAINLMDARIEDNSGYKPCDEVIEKDGDNAYFATIPTRKIVEALKTCDIPASLSYSAGTFVCNNLFYGLLHFVKKNCPEMKCGFIHVPYLPEQAELEKDDTPYMKKEIITEALVQIAKQLILPVID